MLFSRNTGATIEELIIESLGAHAVTGATLLEKIRKTLPKTSKETFYRILRSLLEQEVVTKYGMLYGVNRHWLKRLYRFSKPKLDLTQPTNAMSVLSFEEGDSITYTFKTPNLMGIYWAHLYDAVFDLHYPQIPILIFHPHEWLIYTRMDSETLFLKRFSEDQKRGLFSIGGSAELDKEFKKKWSSKYLEIATGASYGLKNTEYLNVLGDFIFKVKVSTRFAKDIDGCFKKYKTISDDSREELMAICNRPDKVKMVFTRSKKEADKWRTKWKKDYFMPVAK